MGIIQWEDNSLDAIEERLEQENISLAHDLRTMSISTWEPSLFARLIFTLLVLALSLLTVNVILGQASQPPHHRTGQSSTQDPPRYSLIYVPKPQPPH